MKLLEMQVANRILENQNIIMRVLDNPTTDSSLKGDLRLGINRTEDILGRIRDNNSN